MVITPMIITIMLIQPVCAVSITIFIIPVITTIIIPTAIGTTIIHTIGEQVFIWVTTGGNLHFHLDGDINLIAILVRITAMVIIAGMVIILTGTDFMMDTGMETITTVTTTTPIITDAAKAVAQLPAQLQEKEETIIIPIIIPAIPLLANDMKIP